jgi:hypothetical protein
VFSVISKIGFGSKRFGTVEFPMTECISLYSPIAGAAPSSTQRAWVAFRTLPSTSELFVVRVLGCYRRDTASFGTSDATLNSPMFSFWQHITPRSYADRDV